VVVVGGGVIGLSTAYHLARAGVARVVLLERYGVDLPVTPLRRQVVVTEPVAGLDPAMPFTIDFATSMYFHREGPGLLMGMPEKADSWSFDLTRSTEWLVELAEAMQRRTPSLGDVGLTRGWAGLYEMTPDHNALIGRSSSVPGFWYATGFSGHGFLMGPAVGEVMRDLYLGHTPFVDVSGLSVDRFRVSEVRPEINIVCTAPQRSARRTPCPAPRSPAPTSWARRHSPLPDGAGSMSTPSPARPRTAPR